MDIFSPASSKNRIIIIGGGFGGIEIAKHINTKKYEVLLIDRHNYFTFQPLLYQVATGGLEPDSVAYPLRKIVKRKKNMVFRLGQVNSIDSAKKIIETSIGPLPYDILIIATGSMTNFFGMEGVERNAMNLKSVPDALNLRSFILQNFEQALLARTKEEQKELMNFVIVGAGPTGVEISGSLAELKRHILPTDYPELDISMMEITIVEAGANVLDAMSEFAKKKSAKQLEELGVKILLNQHLVSYDGEIAKLKDGTEFKTKALIWTAGVKGNLPDGIAKETIARGNRLIVDDYNRVKGFENIFAIGDASSMESGVHPMLAPVAMQQGKLLAKNLERFPDKWKKFKYFDKGTMATIGRSRAVADLWFNIHLKGFLAWMAWLFIHLMLLVGFRNRVIVLWNWVWNYFSYDRAIRLIIRPFKMDEKQKET
jgi:NADH dehydrogenase